MGEPIDDHTLDAYLAQRIGVEVEPIIETRLFERFYEPGDTACSSVKWDRQEVIVGYWMKGTKTKWNPLHDANQMERVEEAIVKKYFHVTYRIYDTESVCRINNWAWHKAENKKRAFARAVYAMDQSQKGMT